MNKTNMIATEDCMAWMCKLACVDGLLTQSEETVIREFAEEHGADCDELIEKCKELAMRIKPEVERIDYKERNGVEFEKMIVSLLADRQLFKVLDWTGDKYVNGLYAKSNLDPDLHIRQAYNSNHIDYYVECKWRHYWSRDAKRKFFYLPNNQIDRYRRFGHDNHRRIFIAYGRGGTGWEPETLYIIPLERFDENGRIAMEDAEENCRIAATSEAFAGFFNGYFSRLFEEMGENAEHSID
jgi:hypothetical protein